MLSKSQSFKIALWTVLITVPLPSHRAGGSTNFYMSMTGRDKVGICSIDGDRFYRQFPNDTTCTHEDTSLETVAIKRSVFYGLLMVYKKGLEHSKKLLRMIQDEPHDLAKINQIEKKRTEIESYLNVFHHQRTGTDVDNQGDLAHFFQRQKTKMRSCYDLRKLIFAKVGDAVPCHYNPHATACQMQRRDDPKFWWTFKEQLMVGNIVTYYPKWWEHTDLGFACDLFIKKTKDLTPLDLRSYPHHRYRRDDVSDSDLANYKRQATQNIESLEEAIQALEHVVGLEVIEARYHANDASKKGKICSPHTATRVVTKTGAKGPSPDWHRLFSSAVLDARQDFPGSNIHWVTAKPFSAFISGHPYPNYNGDLYRQLIMSEDVRYITFVSTPTRAPHEEADTRHHPGLPMLFVPGIDYVAPEMTKDPDALGITVYSHPLAVCTPQSDDTKRAIRIFN